MYVGYELQGTYEYNSMKILDKVLEDMAEDDNVRDNNFYSVLGEDFVDFLNTTSLVSTASADLAYIMICCYDLKPSDYPRKRYLKLVLYKVAELLGKIYAVGDPCINTFSVGFKGTKFEYGRMCMNALKVASIYRAYIRYYYDHICKT